MSAPPAARNAPAAAAPHPEYEVRGVVWIGRGPGAARLYWRSVRADQGFRRLLAGLDFRRPTSALEPALAWIPAVEARLRAQFENECCFVWRPAAPGVSRASLGWVGDRKGRLIAISRHADGQHRPFLERSRRALEALAREPALQGSVPQLRCVHEEGDALLLVESACAGRPSSRLHAAAATWLGAWQASSGSFDPGQLQLWRSCLRAAIAAHGGLRPLAVRRLLLRLGAVSDAPLVAAHGDFWHGNLLYGSLPARRVSVVDWSEFQPRQHPFHDAGFLLLTCGRDGICGRRPLPPGQWLRRAFAPGARFRRRAESWFQTYRAALRSAPPGAWSRRWNPEFADLLAFLPLTMAHYACFGQQAARWTEAVNAWADDG